MARDVREHGRFCLKHRNLTEITYLLQYIFSAYFKVVLYMGTTVDRWKDGQRTVDNGQRQTGWEGRWKCAPKWVCCTERLQERLMALKEWERLEPLLKKKGT